MIITYYGLNCFKIQGNQVKLLIDPYSTKSGLKSLSPSKLESDVILLSNDIAVEKPNLSPNTFLISNPGEYEIKEAFIYGVPGKTKTVKGVDHPVILYLIEIEGISIAYLSLLGGNLTNGQVERIEGADILIIPVGGGLGLTAKEANDVISQVEPRIVIPMNYKFQGLKIELDPLVKFAKEMGIKEEEIDKYKIVKKDLPQEETKIIILKPQ